MFLLIPKYLEMQNDCIEFYCPNFYPDESSFKRHVRLYQTHYVILLSSAEKSDMPLDPLASAWPSSSNSSLGGFLEV